jgi:hypothetical protein
MGAANLTWAVIRLSPGSHIGVMTAV